MKLMPFAIASTLAASLVATPFVLADPTSVQRAPAVPLVTIDPYFSIWSAADALTDKPTTHWTGKTHRLTSLIRIDGQTYRLMGDAPQQTPALKQVAVTVKPTQTVYDFEDAGVHVALKFTTPLLPDDLMVLSRPVGYVTWTVRSIDGRSHETAVYLDAASEIAVDRPEQPVVTGRQTVDALNVLSVGSEEQPVLMSRGDDHRIDWGHLYLAADSAGSTAAIAAPAAARDAFSSGAPLPSDAAPAATPARDAAALAVMFPLGSVGSQAVSKHLTLAYDDEFSIKYFRENLRPYWRKDGATASDLLTDAAKDYASLLKRCDAFDEELIADLTKVGGTPYAQIGVLAWRQALAAQKVCADAKGQPLSFAKENFSNGCIATVDVLYPAAPQMVIFAPSLLKASLVPILDYSSSPLWKFDSAPHDLGQYPHAVGQIYGGETSSPMPVEETGNMLIMVAALAKSEGNAEFAGKYWPVLTTWCKYLEGHGLDPENQLCTDDFAGHIARNSNLSVKAIMGIASYGMLADMLGKKAEAREALATARDYAQKWTKMGADGDHHQLVFGDKGKGTWSQKYNLVWDKLLDLNVFPPEVARNELAFYRTKMTRFGLPLDSRKTYTKLDWQFWTATMAEDDGDFRKMVDACATWANATPARVPLTDWYDTDTGKQSGFQARSVVGGVFIGLMRDRSIWAKYAKRDTVKLTGWAELPWKMPPMRKLLATADTASAPWRYTTSAPAEQWMNSSFDEKGWKTGQSGFGTRDTPGAVVHTEWNTPDIFLRRDFNMPEGELHDPQLLIHHDEDVEVYINGVLATKASGFQTNYTPFPLSKAARAALRPGKNVLAVHCRQRTGGQYIDVGLVDVLPMPANKGG